MSKGWSMFIRASFAFLCLASGDALAAPEAVRSKLAARLLRELPDLKPADYALGSAALDPELRAKIEENADAGVAAIEAGRKLWSAKFRDGSTLASCFPNGGRRIAQNYPQYDSRLKRVITLEMAVNQCLKTHGQPLYGPADPATMGVVTSYVRSLADGQKVKVLVPAAAQEQFEQGRRLYYTRLGQRNFACASCHVQSAGKRYGEMSLSPAIGQATHWPVIRAGKPVMLQSRIRECLELMGAAPFPAGFEELNQIEFFLTYLSNGQPLKANVWRPN
ncbi:MAG: sulfur oxidation c-type cytochrome SoxA [Usitatibacter sp.]